MLCGKCTLSSAATASWVADLTSSALTDRIWSPCISLPSASTKPPLTISDTNTPVSFLVGKEGRRRHDSETTRLSTLVLPRWRVGSVLEPVVGDALSIQCVNIFPVDVCRKNVAYTSRGNHWQTAGKTEDWDSVDVFSIMNPRATAHSSEKTLSSLSLSNFLCLGYSLRITVVLRAY